MDVQPHVGFRLNWQPHHDSAFWNLPRKTSQSSSEYPRRPLGKTSIHGGGDVSPGVTPPRRGVTLSFCFSHWARLIALTGPKATSLSV